jgi:hypothetical protein
MNNGRRVGIRDAGSTEQPRAEMFGLVQGLSRREANPPPATIFMGDTR